MDYNREYQVDIRRRYVGPDSCLNDGKIVNISLRPLLRKLLQKFQCVKIQNTCFKMVLQLDKGFRKDEKKRKERELNRNRRDTDSEDTFNPISVIVIDVQYIIMPSWFYISVLYSSLVRNNKFM